MIEPTVREQLLIRLERAGASVEAAIVDALEEYLSLLARWNLKVNLTALPLDPPGDDTFDRLFVEPLVAADHLQPPNVRDVPINWLDLGSGGGSPAVPLKIVRRSWTLTMVEAKERKAAFLREAVRALRLEGAAVANVRFEQLQPIGTADLVTVRAVRLDAGVTAVIRKLLRPEGLLAVFGSSEASAPGMVVDHSVPLTPAGSAVLTVLRVPRGT